MKYGFTKIAVCTPEVRTGAVEQNRNAILQAIKIASEQNAELIVFGRLGLSGAGCDSMFYYSTLLQGCVESLAKIATVTEQLSSVLIIGLPIKLENKIYDCSAIINKGKILALIPHYNGNGIFSDFDGDVMYVNVNGADVPFGKKIALYDAAQNFTAVLKDSKTSIENLPVSEIVIEPSIITEVMELKSKLFRQSTLISDEGKCCYVSVGCGVGSTSGGSVMSSHKIISDINGCAVFSGLNTDTLLMAETDVGSVSHIQTASGSIADRKQNSYKIVGIDCDSGDKPECLRIDRTPLKPHTVEDCRDIIEILSHGIMAHLNEVGIKKVVLGVSGGLDSSFALLLLSRLFMQENLPRENILAVAMNTPFNSRQTVRNAQKLIRLLGIPVLRVPVNSAVESNLRSIGHQERLDTVHENAQARQRTQVLLNLANRYNALLIGTGNLSEAVLGWSTYGGDQVAHFNPNGWLTKTAIRELMTYFAADSNSRELTNVILDILSTPVSPELKPDQETETILGPYELHDFFIDCIINKGCDVEKTLFLSEQLFKELSGRDIAEYLRTFITRFFQNRFKQNYSCASIPVFDNNLPQLLEKIRSGFDSEQWLKKLNNLKNPTLTARTTYALN